MPASWSEGRPTRTSWPETCDPGAEVVIHPVDRLAALTFAVDRNRLRVFPDGWGDETMLALMGTLGELESIAESADVRWGRKEEHPGRRVRRGHWKSPIAPLLVPEARVVPVEHVEPAAGTDRTAVIMPAWNDHGFATRRRLAVRLAERGIGSMLFDVPFYGERRVVPEPVQAIRTVADFALMGYGAVVEARALLASIEGTPGVTGFSMGGTLAALVSASLAGPVATAPLAGAHSPAPVYLDGIFSKAVAWPALGGRDASGRLRQVLLRASALDLPARPHHRAAVVAVARSDGFVPRAASARLAEHWDAELRTIPGGHATVLWRRREALADAVADAFDRVDGYRR